MLHVSGIAAGPFWGSIRPVLVEAFTGEANGAETARDRLTIHESGQDTIAGLSVLASKANGAPLIVFYEPPTFALARRIDHGEESESAFDGWVADAKKLLDVYRRNRRNCLLVDAYEAVKDADGLATLLNSFGAPTGKSPARPLALPAPPSPTTMTLAAHFIAENVNLATRAHELAACTRRLSNDADGHYPIERRAVFDDWAALRNSLNAKAREIDDLEETLVDAAEEKELLLEQIKVLQRQIEQMAVFDGSALRAEIATFKKRNTGLKAKINRLERELEQRDSAINAIKQSGAWRLLAPVRWAKSGLGGAGAGKTKKQAAVIRGSDLFDADWYLSKYPDVAKSGVDPALHFADAGWREGRQPGPGFDCDSYLEKNPDVKAADINPLWHYIVAGKNEGRRLR